MKPRPVTLPSGAIVDASRVAAVQPQKGTNGGSFRSSLGHELHLLFSGGGSLIEPGRGEIIETLTNEVAALIWPPEPAPVAHIHEPYIPEHPEITRLILAKMRVWLLSYVGNNCKGLCDTAVVNSIGYHYPGSVPGFLHDIDPETATVLCGRCKLPILGGLCDCNHDATADVLAGGDA